MRGSIMTARERERSCPSCPPTPRGAPDAAGPPAARTWPAQEPREDRTRPPERRGLLSGRWQLRPGAGRGGSAEATEAERPRESWSRRAASSFHPRAVVQHPAGGAGAAGAAEIRPSP